MKTAKQILEGQNKLYEGKRQKVRDQIECQVLKQAKWKDLDVKETFVDYMDDLLRNELEEAGYTVKLDREGFFFNTYSISWK